MKILFFLMPIPFFNTCISVPYIVSLASVPYDGLACPKVLFGESHHKMHKVVDL